MTIATERLVNGEMDLEIIISLFVIFWPSQKQREMGKCVHMYVCELLFIPVGGWLRRMARIRMFPRSATYSVPSGDTTKEEGQLSLASLA